MKIDILTSDGSPLGVTEKSIYGDGTQIGIGGSELALLTMCRAWKERGNDVRLYNDPREREASCFTQLNISEFNPSEDRDILIIFRSPNPQVRHAKGKKIWWSCDQNTVGGFKEFSQRVSKIVCISPFHARFFKDEYGIENTTVIDIPVREWDYTEKVDKVPNQFIFCSVPDRGLIQLEPIWKEITRLAPQAQLHITSDWRLWDCRLGAKIVAGYRLKFAEYDNVHYHAAISRMEMVKLQQQSVSHIYPCIYPELFCIAVAETQYAGAWPITSNRGALATTNMGKVIMGDPTMNSQKYVDAALDVMSGKHTYCNDGVKERFSIAKAITAWDEVFNG